MTHYLQDELTAFWGRLAPYFVILESNQQDGTGPIGRVTIDTDDHQAFALHTTDVKPEGDTSENPTGQSARARDSSGYRGSSIGNQTALL